MLAFVGVVAVAGCGAVDVARPSEFGDHRLACARLLDVLPDMVDGVSARGVQDDSYAAAWGDPAIVVRCGVGVPADYEPFSPCQRVDGVDWFVPDDYDPESGTDLVLTTIGRVPAVELRLPAAYHPPATALVDLAEPINAHTAATAPCN